MDLNDNPVTQTDALSGDAFNLPLEHRHRVQQADAIAHDHPGLLAISGNDHDRAALAWTEVVAPVLERGQEHRDASQNEALAAAPADAQPSLAERSSRWRAAARVLLVERELFLGHRQGEQYRQKRQPRRPGLRLEVLAEDLGIADGVEDVHGASSSSSACWRA